MDTQLTLFDQPTAPQINTVPPTSCKIIQFPGTSAVEPPKKVNYRKGEEQTVFPIKSREQLDAMASWLRANADPKYLLAFILGINLGLRANELLELKCSDIFFPDGKIRYIVGDYTDTTDKISVFQEKVDKRRGLYLNESCVHAIQWYYGNDAGHYSDGYIFASREGGHIEVDTLRKKLKDAAKACRTSVPIPCGRLSDTSTTRATTTLCSSSVFSVIPALSSPCAISELQTRKRRKPTTMFQSTC